MMENRLIFSALLLALLLPFATSFNANISTPHTEFNSHPNAILKALHLKSSSNYTLKKFNNFTQSRIQLFFIEQWNTQIKIKNRRKIEDYAMVVSSILVNTAIPKTVEILERVSEILMNGNKDIFKNHDNFISVKDYIKNIKYGPANLIKMINNIHLNKMALFAKFISNSSMNFNKQMGFYGYVALKNILNLQLTTAEVNEILKTPLDVVYFQDTKLIFSHPEYKQYYAARYFFNKFETNDTKSLTKSLAQINFLQKSKYAEILEYINSGIINYQSSKFKSFLYDISQKPGEFPKIMDNLIIHGFDDLTALILTHLNNSDILSEYFQVNQTTSQILESNIRYNFGLMSNSTTTVKCNRQEMMIRMNMEKALSVAADIQTSHSKLPSTIWRVNDFKMYLSDILLKQDKPNEKIYKILIDRLVESNKDEFLNKLVYKTMNYSGIEGGPIILDLVSRGANPQAINIEGRTLLHLAVKKCDLELLQFVVEELHVPIPDSSSNQSILIEALDSNPFPQRSRHRFWETMNYLMKKKALHVPKSDHPQLMQTGNIFTAHEFSSFYETFAASHSISGFELAQFPPEVQSYCRNLVLQDCYRQLIKPKLAMSTRAPDTTTLTEVLLKYQGGYNLLYEETAYFRRTIQAAIKYDTTRKSLSPHQLERLRQVLRSGVNVGAVSHVYNIVKNIIVPNLSRVQSKSVIKTVINSMWLKQSSFSTKKNITLEAYSKIGHTFNPPSPTSFTHYAEIRSGLRNMYKNFRTKFGTFKNGIACLFSNNPSGCAFSEENAPKSFQFEGNSDNSQSTIETGEILEQLEQAEAQGDAVRSSQIMDVANEIAENPSSELSGNRLTAFKKVAKKRWTWIKNKASWIKEKTGNWNPFKNSVQKIKTKISKNPVTTATIMNMVTVLVSIARVSAICDSPYKHIKRNCPMELTGVVTSFVLVAIVPLLPKLISYAFCFKTIKKIKTLKNTLELGFDPIVEAELRQKEMSKIRYKNLASKFMLVITIAITAAADIYEIVQISLNLKACLENDCPTGVVDDYIVQLSICGIKLVLNILLPFLIIDIARSTLVHQALVLGVMILQHLITVFRTLVTFNLSLSEFWRVLFPIFYSSNYGSLLNAARNNLEGIQKFIMKTFDKSEAIVAVAVALGAITDIPTGQIEKSPCIINMKDRNLRNTMDLARVLPEKSTETIQLCLHHMDNAKNVSNVSGENQPTSIYYCAGAIVLGHDDRWNRVTKGYILYILDKANSAEIYGNDNYGNYYMINDLTNPSKIVGGELSNHYSMIYARNTTIFLNPMAKEEIIDFTQAKVVTVRLGFKYELSAISGYISFDINYPCDIFWKYYKKTSDIRNGQQGVKQIHGRAGKQDEIQCMDSAMDQIISKTHTIFVNGYGGKSKTEIDIIKDCKQAILHPFSDYYMTIPNSTYVLEAKLDRSEFIRDQTKFYSNIYIEEGDVIINFQGKSVTKNTISMTYVPTTNILTWELVWSQDTIMVLKVIGYYRNLTAQERQQTGKNGEVPAIQFRDGYLNCSFNPSIDRSNYDEDEDSNSTIDIKHFSIGITMSGTELKEAISAYDQIIITKSAKIDLAVSIMSSITQNTYVFGKNDTDIVYFNQNVKYLAGFNGTDYYTVLQHSPEFVWINNYAIDQKVDYLAIPAGVCESLKIRSNVWDLPSLDISDQDIIITCLLKNVSYRINVILEKYLTDESYRHIGIFWDDVPYAIAPHYWNLTSDVHSRFTDEPNTFNIIEFYDMEKYEEGIINLNTSGPCVLYVKDKNNPFEACSRNEHVILGSKRQNVFLNLLNFYVIENEHEEIAAQWKDILFFIADDLSEGASIRELDAKDIDSLVQICQNEAEEKIEAIDELTYRVYKNKPINYIIDRNYDQSNSTKEILPLFLEFNRLYPEDVFAEWENNTLQILSASSNITVKNWCESENHRFKLIQFFSFSQIVPIVIEDTDKLACQVPYEGNQVQIVNALNTKFSKAQELVPLLIDSETDDAIFRKCVGIYYAENVTSIPMDRLFGFPDFFEQALFMENTCSELMTPKSIINLDQDVVRDEIEKNIARYEISCTLRSQCDWPDKENVFYLLRGSFRKYSNDWYYFLSRVYHRLFPNEQPINFKHNADIDKAFFGQLEWYEQAARYLQHCR